MKAPLLVHSTWAAIAVAAFSLGCFITSESGGAKRGVPFSAQHGTTPSSPWQLLSNAPSPSSAGAPEVLNGEEIRSRAFEIALEPKRIERMRQLCDLLPQVTPQNWREVLEGFENAIRARPPGPTENYNILLEHVGAVAGKEALEDALSPENVMGQERFTLMLKGWVSCEPKAGIAWFEAQDPELQHRHIGQFVAGLSRTEPRKALEFTFMQDEAFYKGGTTTAVVNNGLQLLGLKGVEDILTSMSARSDIPEAAKGKLFAEIVNRRLTLSKSDKSYEEVLGWFDSYVGHPYISARESHRIVSEAAKSNPQAALSWVETKADQLTPAQASAGFAAVAAELQKQAPQQLSAWLSSHPVHPQRDNVLEVATGALIQSGDLEGASRTAGAIENAELRARVTSTVQKRVQSQQTKVSR